MTITSVALIPTYKPDDRLIETIKALRGIGFKKIVVVDDGSGDAFCDIFSEVINNGVHICTHAQNLGKGRALKTGFNYILLSHPGYGAVSVDADGQHNAKDAARAAKLVDLHSNSLILGCRKFRQIQNIPLPNLLGNLITRSSVFLFTDMWFSDTQCGLRGYPPEVMRKLIELPGERFEFETAAFLYARHKGLRCVEYPVDVNYDKKGVYSTTFRRIIDSALIYKTLFRPLLSPTLCFFAASMAILLTFSLRNTYAENIISVYVSLFLSWFILSMTAKYKLLCCVGGFFLTIVYTYLLVLLVKNGLSISLSYLILALPAAVIGLLAYRIFGFGWKPHITRYKD